MKRFILTSLAITALAALACANTVGAAPGHGPAHVTHVTHVGPIHVTHVAPVHINFATHTNLLVHGRYVNAPFRVAGYYCPVDSLWYYWYAPMNQYLPVTYMADYPPTQFAPPVGFAPNPVLPQGIAPPSGATLIPGPITAP
jgi:hypothetical protein